MFMFIGMVVTIFIFVALGIKNKDMLIEFYKSADKDIVAFTVLFLAIGFCVAWIVWPMTALAAAIYLFIKRKK